MSNLEKIRKMEAREMAHFMSVSKSNEFCKRCPIKNIDTGNKVECIGSTSDCIRMHEIWLKSKASDELKQYDLNRYIVQTQKVK